MVIEHLGLSQKLLLSLTTEDTGKALSTQRIEFISLIPCELCAFFVNFVVKTSFGTASNF
jgi:hypothetical protein